ncbi:MAG: hypothetical protein MZV63_59395 [Marinilabiliales bacterium]|nr:hypothetical protein [Marinilabiliales bacterium]
MLLNLSAGLVLLYRRLLRRHAEVQERVAESVTAEETVAVRRKFRSRWFLRRQFRSRRKFRSRCSLRRRHAVQDEVR